MVRFEETVTTGNVQQLMQIEQLAALVSERSEPQNIAQGIFNYQVNEARRVVFRRSLDYRGHLAVFSYFILRPVVRQAWFSVSSRCFLPARFVS